MSYVKSQSSTLLESAASAEPQTADPPIHSAMFHHLTYQQPVCWTIWNMFDQTTGGKLRNVIMIVQRHFGQSKVGIFCIALATHTCNV